MTDRDVEAAALRRAEIERVCREASIAELYVFGSRSQQVLAWLRGEISALEPRGADVDVGVRTATGTRFSVRAKVALSIALEDLFHVSRADLVSLREADPFLAANIVRGERLYARDEYEADEYVLYVLRRAGDLIPLEKERIALLLGETR